MKKNLFRRVAVAATLAIASAALAQVLPPKVEGAWVRSSVPGQQGTGAFMKITAPQPLELVGISTPAAGIAEVHEMRLEGEIMRMRPLPKLELPAGRTVELKPGGYHLMLQDLKQPLRAGSTVPLTMVFRDAKGAETKLELQVPVGTTAPGAKAGAPAKSMGEHSMDAHKH